MYYLKDNVDSALLKKTIDLLILSDSKMKENTINDISKRLNETFSDKEYIRNLDGSKQRWIDEDVVEITKAIVDYISML